MIYSFPTLADPPAKRSNLADSMVGEAERIRFGMGVRRARAAKKWTQHDLADRSEMRQSYISQIEKGRVPITIDMMAKLARVLEVELHELVKG